MRLTGITVCFFISFLSACTGSRYVVQEGWRSERRSVSDSHTRHLSLRNDSLGMAFLELVDREWTVSDTLLRFDRRCLRKITYSKKRDTVCFACKSDWMLQNGFDENRMILLKRKIPGNNRSFTLAFDIPQEGRFMDIPEMFRISDGIFAPGRVFQRTYRYGRRAFIVEHLYPWQDGCLSFLHICKKDSLKDYTDIDHYVYQRGHLLSKRAITLDMIRKLK